MISRQVLRLEIGMSIANIIMVFHRILDFKMGWISILALFLFINSTRINFAPIINYNHEKNQHPWNRFV